MTEWIDVIPPEPPPSRTDSCHLPMGGFSEDKARKSTKTNEQNIDTGSSRPYQYGEALEKKMEMFLNAITDFTENASAEERKEMEEIMKDEIKKSKEAVQKIEEEYQQTMKKLDEKYPKSEEEVKKEERQEETHFITAPELGEEVVQEMPRRTEETSKEEVKEEERQEEEHFITAPEPSEEEEADDMKGI